jgi:hypothetical protein
MKPMALRYPRPTERWEPYVAFVVWPVIFLAPYGYWTWIVAFVPDVAMRAFRAILEARAPLEVTAKKTDRGIDLLGPDGARVDGFGHADVEAVTREIDRAGRTTLRVARTRARDLLFPTSTLSEISEVSAALDLDLANARARYRAASRAARLGALLLIGFALIVGTFIAKPTPEIARFIVRYTQFVTLPLLVLFAVPTWVDVGRDGIAWRWLFVRKYFPFAALTRVEPDRRVDPRTLVLVEKNRAKHTLILEKRSAAVLVKHAVDGFASRTHEEQAPIEAFEQRVAPRDTEETRAWLSRLRAMGAGDGAYRTMPTADLWKTAENDALPKDVRLGALVALTTHDGGRERARALALRVVDPELRATIEAIADPERDEAELSAVVEKERSRKV